MFAELVSSGSESVMSNILGRNCVESGDIPRGDCISDGWFPIGNCIEWGHYP